LLGKLDSLNRLSGIYYANAKEALMADAPRITAEELKRRMDAGEDFTVIDTRNPKAWAESDTVIPEAIRVPLDELEQNLPRIPRGRPVVAYCT
jgi:rhodanese-related sulfurtransferase